MTRALTLLVFVLSTALAQATEPVSHVLFPLQDSYTILNNGDSYYGITLNQAQDCAPFTGSSVGFDWRYSLIDQASGTGCYTPVIGVDLYPTFSFAGSGGAAFYYGVTSGPTLGPGRGPTGGFVNLRHFNAQLYSLGCTAIDGGDCTAVGDQYVLSNTGAAVGIGDNYFLFSKDYYASAHTWASFLDHGLRLGGSVSPATAGYYLDVAGGNLLLTGNLDITGTALTSSNLSSCGTSPSMGALSYDTSGTFTVGTLATGCVLTFASAKAQIPRCFANDQTGNAVAVQIIPTTTTLTFSTATAATISSDTIDYWCVGKH